MKYVRTICLSVVVFSITVPALFAQFEAATVLRTIRDTSGAVVPNCKVTLENLSTAVTVSTRTAGLGNYEFVNQHLGAYKVRAEAAGFQTAEPSSFELTPNARQHVDPALMARQAAPEVPHPDHPSL